MMRSSLLTLLFAVAAPLSIGSAACFLSTEGDGYEYDDYGDTGGCEVGVEGCPCTSGGSCNPPMKCDNNLNICILDTCPVGNEGCDCTPGGTCNPALTCLSKVCVAQCSPGTEGCPCTDGGGCDPLLSCLSNVCVDPTTGPQDDSADDDSGDGPAADTGDDTTGDTTGGGCGQCTPPAACPADGEACQCDCIAQCDGDDVVICPNGASGCQEVHACANGCEETETGPECIPSSDSSSGG